MKKRMILSLLAALAIIAIGAPQASAGPACCEFIVHAPKSLCFPIVLTVDWGGGATQTVTISSGGVWMFPITAPCPPTPAIQGISLLPVTCCFTADFTRSSCGCPLIEFCPC